MAEGKYLRPKYAVSRIEKAGEYLGPIMKSTDPDDVDSPFVLMPRKDPVAFSAMLTYARYCEPGLGNEIKAWLRKVASADVVTGTQGMRNQKAMKHMLLALMDEVI